MSGVRGIAHLLAVIITVYGGLLRLDAFTGKYGPLDRPGWARVVTRDVAALVPPIRPAVTWASETNPYVGGDPINYLRFAREMEGFYQAHVREPVFLATTRLALWSLDDQDAAVSFASLAGSIAAIFATYLLGRAVVSPLAGLLAALALAIEYEAIIWAPDGWRDDTFTATVILAAWALVRLGQQRALDGPALGRAALAGGLCAVACLTRITALTFVIPALGWIVLDGPAAERRIRLKLAAVAAAVGAIVLGPYLVSCAIETGDPLIAINYHTTYYRAAEGRAFSEPMSATDYLRARLAERPVATFDTAFNGLFVQPFVTKWHGFGFWADGIGAVLRALGLAGLAVFPFIRPGRLLVVMLLTSLLPYVFTWNLGGGGEWRFTMHAYPFYLVAAGAALAWIVRAASEARASRRLPIAMSRRTLAGVAAIAAAAAAGAALYVALPWFVVREAIAHGESTSLEIGDRDRIFYRGGWSPPRAEGITARVSTGARSTVRVPLPARAEYDIVLRLDPVAPAVQSRVRVLFNGHYVGDFPMTWDPERVGTYRLRVRAPIVNEGGNLLTIIPDRTVAAAAAGPAFAWLDPETEIGLRVWYVRVLPNPDGA